MRIGSGPLYSCSKSTKPINNSAFPHRSKRSSDRSLHTGEVAGSFTTAPPMFLTSIGDFPHHSGALNRLNQKHDLLLSAFTTATPMGWFFLFALDFTDQ